jgi:endonuclease/exonuclease/phosphatase family metal-dependent hydrolase
MLARLRRFAMRGVVSALALGLVSPSVAGASPLRIVTVNMLHGGMTLRTGDGQRLEERLALTIGELRRLDADVIGLQEASDGPGRGDAAAAVAAALGCDHVRAPAAYRWIGRLAAWRRFRRGPDRARLPILSTATIHVPSCGEWYGRTAICAVLTAPGGPSRSAPRTSRVARASSQLATALLARRGDHPLVLAGDLNATPRTAGVRGLVARLGFVDAFHAMHPGDSGFTVWQPVRAPERAVRRRVDYVLAAPGARPVRVLSSRVVLDVPGRGGDGEPLWPSDHYGVVAEVEVADGIRSAP